jgi:hypothetical protein
MLMTFISYLPSIATPRVRMIQAYVDDFY